MKHIKIISAIIIAAMLTGCADTAPDSSTPEVTTTAATTTVTTTAATTTESTTTTAETTVPTVQTTTTVDTTIEPEPDQIVESDPIADQIAQERDDAIYTPTTEEAEDHAQDREDRQDMADNTSNYTTEGIPLTTDGDLTAPAKPTADYELPANAQLEFTGNPDTALLTELPDGCYWTPGRAGSENAFMDPAGNLWLNTETNTITNIGSGYYSPDGDYHPSQYEINEAIRFNAEAQERWENGPTGGKDDIITDKDKEEIQSILGW